MPWIRERGWLWWTVFLLLAGTLVFLIAPRSTEKPYEPPSLALSSFENWYRVYDQEEAVIGFCHLKVSPAAAGGHLVEYLYGVNRKFKSDERKISMLLDADCQMVSSSFENPITGARSEIARQGDEVRGWHVDGEGEERQDFVLATDAPPYGALLFVLAAALPQEEGVLFRAQEVGQRTGLSDFGGGRIYSIGHEELDVLGPAHRYVKRSRRGEAYSVWVAADGQIVGFDWARGEHAMRADEPTDHLYERQHRLVLEVECDQPAFMCLECELPGWEQEDLYRHFTEPRPMETWWPEVATVDARDGGDFILSFPSKGEEMQGRIQHIDPPLSFSFRWHWSGTDESRDREVAISFAPTIDGARVSMRHGPFPEGREGDKERRSLHDGWDFFIHRLAETRKKKRDD